MSLRITLDKLSQLPRAQRSAIVLTTLALLVLRGRLLQLPQEVLTSMLVRTRRGDRVTQQELDRALQQVYEKAPDGTKILLVPHRQRISKVCQPCFGTVTLLLTCSGTRHTHTSKGACHRC